MKGSGVKAISGLIGFLAVGFLAYGVSASTLRCSGRLVDLGDYQHEVQAKCGPPSATHVWAEEWHATFAHLYPSYHEDYAAYWQRKGPIYYERWIYLLGAQRFSRHLLFRNGVLIKIELGNKG